MSKYEPLWKYVKENKKDEYKLSFEEVKQIVGFDFDHAFLTFKKKNMKNILNDYLEIYHQGIQ